MSRFNYNSVLWYQYGLLRNSQVEPKKKDELINLGNVLLLKIIDNNYKTDGIVLFYPEDCNDYDIFADFARALRATIANRAGGGYKMHSFKGQ